MKILKESISSRYYRQCDDIGRIVLPRGLREELGFERGQWFELIPSENGDLTLHKVSESEVPETQVRFIPK